MKISTMYQLHCMPLANVDPRVIEVDWATPDEEV